jgi:putative GTP pyrophosphokinase
MNKIENKIEDFKGWYENQLPYHNAAVQFFCDLISKIPKVESVKGRTKSFDECISKFKRKYLPLLKPEESNFEILNLLTDTIGIRAICFYSEKESLKLINLGTLKLNFRFVLLFRMHGARWIIR